MKILSVRTARSIWLIPTIFINPRGRYIRHILGQFAERYGFSKIPLPAATESDKDGLKFEDGKFTLNDGTKIALNFTVHTDGLVAEVRSSTQHGDQFLQDAMSWVAAECSLPKPSDLPIRKIYGSEIFLQFDRAPEVFNRKMTNFQRTLSSILGTGKSGLTEFTSLSFGSDPTKTTPQTTFRIERELNTTFGDNRYYSFATCQTEDHIKLLEELEQAAIA